MAFDYIVKVYKHWRLYSEFTQIVTQMEDEHLFNEKQSIRDSARSLKKYGSTCNHIRNNDILIRHEIDKNDTLQGIALKYGCTTEQIRRANRLFASDSLFLRQYLMIPIERNSPYYLKDERPHSLPTQRAASIAGYYTTVSPSDTNASAKSGQADDDQQEINSKSMEFVASSSSPMSPEEENKRNIDEFLCKIDTTLAETKKYVAKSKNSDFSQSDNDIVGATSFTDGTNRHSSGNINHNNYYYQQEQSYNNNHYNASSYSANNHKRNNSSGNSSNTGNNDPQHLIVMTQGRRIQNSLQRLEKQQDEFFEL